MHLMRSTHALAVATAVALALSAAPVEAQQRFALQLFHFNVQYVCGGTLGWSTQPDPVMDLDNDTVEDRIITESFAPIVELFEQHPSWGVDLEMQGYMLDILAARHPDVLGKLRTMAQSGQIDVVSFHYSDQLFIGYPEQDWLRSQALTAATFAEHDVPLSRTVFCQEGQAGAAMAGRMAELGYRNMVWPKNLWSFQHGDFTAEPLYRFGDVLLVAGSKEVSTAEVEVVWTFLDDGELLATGDVNPYLADQFFADPEEVAAYEAQLLDLETQGYRIATVDQYVEAVGEDVQLADPPPLLDGTWQPNSTQGVKRWLGGGGLWRPQERDNHVRSLAAQAHRELAAAETIAAGAGLSVRAELDAAWRMLFLGQVTDATGINPFQGEIQYGLAHQAEALRIARNVIRQGKTALGHAAVLIDPLSDAVAPADGTPVLRGEPAEPPLALEIEPGDRPVAERWERIGPGHHRVAIEFGPGEFNRISVRFPGQLTDELTVTRALEDDEPFTYTRSDFSFEDYYFALPTGLISIGTNRFVIKDQAQVHLAAHVWIDSADVEFLDETAPTFESQRWVFHLLEGSAEEAVALAQRINTHRRLLR